MHEEKLQKLNLNKLIYWATKVSTVADVTIILEMKCHSRSLRDILSPSLPVYQLFIGYYYTLSFALSPSSPLKFSFSIFTFLFGCLVSLNSQPLYKSFSILLEIRVSPFSERAVHLNYPSH